MRADAVGHVWIFLKQIAKIGSTKYVFRDFGKVSEELQANGPQNQLLRRILLKIHLS